MSSKALVVIDRPQYASLSQGILHRLMERITRLLARLVVAGLEYRLKRKTIMTLSALDDRMLADIGLDRSEIHSVIHDRALDRTRARFSLY